MTITDLVTEIERRLEIRLNGSDAARLANPSGAEALLELIRRWRIEEKPTEAFNMVSALDPADLAKLKARIISDYETDKVSQRPARRRK